MSFKALFWFILSWLKVFPKKASFSFRHRQINLIYVNDIVPNISIFSFFAYLMFKFSIWAWKRDGNFAALSDNTSDRIRWISIWVNSSGNPRDLIMGFISVFGTTLFMLRLKRGTVGGFSLCCQPSSCNTLELCDFNDDKTINP